MGIEDIVGRKRSAAREKEADQRRAALERVAMSERRLAELKEYLSRDRFYADKKIGLKLTKAGERNNASLAVHWHNGYVLFYASSTGSYKHAAFKGSIAGQARMVSGWQEAYSEVEAEEALADHFVERGVV